MIPIDPESAIEGVGDSVVSKYHEPEEHMNIYEVPLTIKVNPMWHFIPGMLSRSKIVTRFLLNSINNEIK